MADHLSLTHYNHNVQAEIATTKRIFVYYLWGMFNDENFQLSRESANVRNWIWDHRKLIFENKLIFHWILANILRHPYNWSNIMEEFQSMSQGQIRKFFNVLTAFFVDGVSMQDIIRLENYEFWSDSEKVIILNALTHRLSISQIIYRDANIDQTDQGLSARINQVRQSPEYINFQRAREIVTRYIPHFQGMPEITQLIIDHERALPYLESPATEQQVRNFIEGLPGWRDFM